MREITTILNSNSKLRRLLNAEYTSRNECISDKSFHLSSGSIDAKGSKTTANNYKIVASTVIVHCRKEGLEGLLTLEKLRKRG